MVKLSMSLKKLCWKSWKAGKEEKYKQMKIFDLE
jgi:hypothetical protein